MAREREEEEEGQALTPDDLDALPSGGCRVERVPAPELRAGASLHVRSLGLEERLRLEEGLGEPPAEDAPAQEKRERGKRWMVRVLAACLCHPDGAPFYDPDSEVDQARVSRLDYTVSQRAFDKALEVNGMRQQDQEGAEKNSGAAPSSGSASSSGSTSGA